MAEDQVHQGGTDVGENLYSLWGNPGNQVRPNDTTENKVDKRQMARALFAENGSTTGVDNGDPAAVAALHCKGLAPEVDRRWGMAGKAQEYSHLV